MIERYAVNIGSFIVDETIDNKVLDTPDDINLMPQSKRQRRK
jgi:hypothetical protein